jgi:hypothetical protein
MPNFDGDRLANIMRQNRDAARAALFSAVENNGDRVSLFVEPDERAVSWFVECQEKNCHRVQEENLQVIKTTPLTFIKSLAVIIFLGVALDGWLFWCVIAPFLSIALVVAIIVIWEFCRRVFDLFRPNSYRFALELASGIGRNICVVGERGIYLAQNKLVDGFEVSSFRFNEIRPPEMDCHRDIMQVCIISNLGDLVRTITLPETMEIDCRRLIKYLDARIGFRRAV